MIKKQGSEKKSYFGIPVWANDGTWDASSEEAPPSCPRKREMSKYLWLQMISMLQSIQCDDGLWMGSITVIAKRFDMTCSTAYQ